MGQRPMGILGDALAAFSQKAKALAVILGAIRADEPAARSLETHAMLESFVCVEKLLGSKEAWSG